MPRSPIRSFVYDPRFDRNEKQILPMPYDSSPLGATRDEVVYFGSDAGGGAAQDAAVRAFAPQFWQLLAAQAEAPLPADDASAQDVPAPASPSEGMHSEPSAREPIRPTAPWPLEAEPFVPEMRPMPRLPPEVFSKPKPPLTNEALRRKREELGGWADSLMDIPTWEGEAAVPVPIPSPPPETIQIPWKADDHAKFEKVITNIWKAGAKIERLEAEKEKRRAEAVARGRESVDVEEFEKEIQRERDRLEDEKANLVESLGKRLRPT